MPTLKSLRLRINSVKSTQKITKAMKMVAASKLRRAQEAVEAGRPYAERMERMLASLSSGLGDNAPRLVAGTGKDQVHLLVVATAERGLCGGFNTTIVRLARRRIEELLGQGKTVKILCVGKKGAAQLRRTYADKIIDVVDLSKSRRIGFADAAGIGDRVLAMYDAGEFDVASIFYNRFKSVISQIPTEQRLIPASLPQGGEANPGTGLMPQPVAIEREAHGKHHGVRLMRNIHAQIAALFKVTPQTHSQSRMRQL